MKDHFKEYQTIIENLITQQNTESLAEKRDNTRKRNLRMAGIINDALTCLTGAGVIVTGGLSVEYYTEGNYTTQDIDVITKEFYCIMRRKKSSNLTKRLARVKGLFC